MDINNLPNNDSELANLKAKSELIKLNTDIEKAKKELELLQSPTKDKFKVLSIIITAITAIGTVLTVALSYHTTTRLYDVKAIELKMKAERYDKQINNLRRIRPKLEELKIINPDENQPPIDRYKIANDVLIIVDTLLNE